MRTEKNTFYSIDTPDLLYIFWIENEGGKLSVNWKEVYDDAGLMMSGGSHSEEEFLAKFKAKSEVIEAYRTFMDGRDD